MMLTDATSQITATLKSPRVEDSTRKAQRMDERNDCTSLSELGENTRSDFSNGSNDYNVSKSFISWRSHRHQRR
jgi:hypothetical protein